MRELPTAIQTHATACFSRFSEKFPDVIPQLTSGQKQQLTQMLGLSDFIMDVLERFPQVTDHLVTQKCLFQSTPPNLDECISSLKQSGVSDFSAQLRLARHIMFGWIAAKHLTEQKTVAETFPLISQSADRFVQLAYEEARASLKPRYGEAMNEQGKPMPLLVLGMGKLGANELNFSSDIDLIFTFPEHGQTQGGRQSVDHQLYFTKLAQRLITHLDQVTMYGRVFRVDMRLRPFGDSGPLVFSFDAMEDYYQEQGREWERYAMLKARSVLPSHDCETFYELIRPFVFRRYIDFSVIDALRKMKKLIIQETRRRQLEDNLKLGRGGIREVEFICQALQLIRGGKDKSLQVRSVFQALGVLEKSGVLPPDVAQKLHDAYLFMRHLEHAVQAFADQQTQFLPSSLLDQARLAYVSHMPNYIALKEKVVQTQKLIHDEFSLLIQEPEEESSEEDEAEWLWAQSQLPQEAIKADSPLIEVILSIREKAQKSPMGQRGRAALDKLLPKVITCVYEFPNEILVLSRVCQVIEAILSRTAYLELLLENQGALKQLLQLCNKSEWITAYLCRYPLLLDELLDPIHLYQPTPLDDYETELREFLLRVDPQDLEGLMEALRHFKHIHQLRIAAADITEVLPLMKVSDHLTKLGEVLLSTMVEHAWLQMVEKYGFPDGMAQTGEKGVLILAYGKFGGIELGYNSDLDLVFLHQCHSSRPTSGPKQIDSRQFYLKLVQRILHLSSTKMTTGELYEIDTRLRPSGQSGLLAIHIETFAEYQAEEAWTWEHQALVRARPVYGSAALEQCFDKIRHQILISKRDLNKLKLDIVQMRQKMRDNLDNSDSGWVDLKQGKGGIADIEFIVQYLVLAHAAQFPQLLKWSDNIRLIETLEDVGVITQEVGNMLKESYISLRRQIHAKALQNEAAKIDKQSMESHLIRVTKFWQVLFQNDGGN